MTTVQQRPVALTGAACLKKVGTLFYVTHPKASRPLLGPFLGEADALHGVTVMRSAGAQVEARTATLDDIAYWHAQNNGAICRAFAQGVAHVR